MHLMIQESVSEHMSGAKTLMLMNINQGSPGEAGDSRLVLGLTFRWFLHTLTVMLAMLIRPLVEILNGHDRKDSKVTWAG